MSVRWISSLVGRTSFTVAIACATLAGPIAGCSDEPPTDASDGPDTCEPRECGADLCGVVDDLCGGTIECGECEAPECDRGTATGNFNLAAQEEVESLRGYDVLDGDLFIREDEGPLDLTPLHCLRQLSGELVLGEELSSLEGLGSLRSTGDISIRDTALSDLDALAELRTAGVAIIIGNPLLVSVRLENLQQSGLFLIQDNERLESVALPAIVELDGLEVEASPELSSITRGEQAPAITGLVSLEELPALREIGLLAGVTELGGPLRLIGTGVSTLVPLASLTRVASGQEGDGAGVVLLIENPALESLEGLQGITRLAGLSVTDNPSLRSLDGLDGLTEVTGLLDVVGNAGLISLEGLHNLATSGVHIEINDNDALVQLDGLRGLRQMDSIRITGNGSLSDVSSLLGLEEWDNFLDITFNPQLSQCGAETVQEHHSKLCGSGAPCAQSVHDNGPCG